MIILIVILCTICLYRVRFSSFNADYLSQKSTNAIRGIFAVLILFSHLKGYLTLPDNILNNSYCIILDKIGQLMVAPYFFYSGYGIGVSVKEKDNYFKKFPRNRIFKTLLHFDIAVLIFIIVQSAIGVFYQPINYITCWIGLSSVGNSNWFIFVILLLYSIVYIAAVLKPKASKLWLPTMTTLFSFAAILTIRSFHPGSWWYNTILTFPLGMWYSYYKTELDHILSRKISGWALILASSALFLSWYMLRGIDGLGICSCLFTVLVVFVCSRIKFDNAILQFLGKLAFALYIMQRLPMNMFVHFGLETNAYLFAAVSIPTALAIAWAYNKLLSIVDIRLQF